MLCYFNLLPIMILYFFHKLLLFFISIIKVHRHLKLNYQNLIDLFYFQFSFYFFSYLLLKFVQIKR
jgi:hypothetical protein